MTIEEIRSYARESGISEEKIELLVRELHPDENGKLRPEEALEARAIVDYVVRLRESTRANIEAVRALRKRERNE